jgi:hypothetical protein
MPTYNFKLNDLANNSNRTGVELKDLAEAKCEAMKFAASVVCNSAVEFWDAREWTLTVTDDAGLALFSLLLLGSEGPSAQDLSRPGFREGTFDKHHKSDETNLGMDGC